jgi:CRP/FNR family transcriptional regulator
LSSAEAGRLQETVQFRQSYARGAILARQGDQAKYLYAIRTGALKRVYRDTEGNEQVVGFAFPGDVVGLDALGSSRHQLDLVALETTAVCLISAARCLDLAGRTPSLLNELFRYASADIQAADQRGALIAEVSADERLMAFLRMLGQRQGARGLSPHEFNLPMSRRDIASYLAMAVETVSRLLGKLQESGAIAIEGRHVVLKQLFSEDPMVLQKSVA